MFSNIKILLVAVMLGSFVATPVLAESPEKLNKDSAQALKQLLDTTPAAKRVHSNAKAVLVFPNIVKAGLVFGGAYGEGVLRVNGNVDGYYNSVTASFGWQAGAQSYGYVVFLMNDKALSYLRDTKGWEIGVGPSVALVDDGVAKNISSTTLKEDAYAFIFDQQGLMASLSIEGTKISRVEK